MAFYMSAHWLCDTLAPLFPFLHVTSNPKNSKLHERDIQFPSVRLRRRLVLSAIYETKRYFFFPEHVFTCFFFFLPITEFIRHFIRRDLLWKGVYVTFIYFFFCDDIEGSS